MRASVLAALAAAVPGTPRAVQVAERAQDGESGHTYLRTQEVLTVYDAEAVARALGGTLAAIGSRAEETFLLENFGASEPYWIGLEFPRARWVTGEVLEFAHWAPAEPDGGAREPFTLLNWGEPGAWVDASGDAETQRFRALIEFPAGVTPPADVPTPPEPWLERGVLLCAIQGLSAKDLENPRLPNLNAFWKASAWTLDAGADGSADPMAGLGMLLWGVGSDRSRLSSANPAGAARNANENLLARLEHALPLVGTAALFDDPALAGILLDGRVDLRVSDASPRRGGSQQAAADALARPTPLCVVAAWTSLRVPGADELSAASRSKELAAIDAEFGGVLASLRARPAFSRERWWVAVAGLAPASDGKSKDDESRARKGVPVCLQAPSAPPGEILCEVALVDLLPSALVHLGLAPRPSWQLDGRALELDAPARYGANLLVNGGGEAQFGWNPGPFPQLTGWRQLAPFRLARHDPAEPGSPERGQSYFQGAAAGLARMEQTLDLRAYAADVERGNVRYRLSGALGRRPGAAASIGCALEFLSEQGKALERAEIGPVGAGKRSEPDKEGGPREGWIELEASGRVPRRARAARVILEAEGSGTERTMADRLGLVLERE